MSTKSHTRPLAGALALAAALSLSLSASPVAAEQSSPGNPDIAEGAQMLSDGFRKLFQGLLGELEPAGDAAEQGWNDMIDWLGDLSTYEAPERLPNGDIIIRRKEELAPSTDL